MIEDLKDYIQFLLEREIKRHNNKYECVIDFHGLDFSRICVNSIRRCVTIKLDGLYNIYDGFVLSKDLITNYIKEFRKELDDPVLKGVFLRIRDIDVQVGYDNSTDTLEKSNIIGIAIPYYLDYESGVSIFYFDNDNDDSCARFKRPSKREDMEMDVYRRPKMCFFYMMFNNIDIYTGEFDDGKDFNSILIKKQRNN